MLRAVSAVARVATTVARPAIVQPFVVEAVVPLRAMCTITQVRGCDSSARKYTNLRTHVSGLVHASRYLVRRPSWTGQRLWSVC